jgi:hypothetical protein
MSHHWDEDGDCGCGGATGNPALDIDGYQSPRRTREGDHLTGYTPSRIDWMALARADREKRRQRRQEGGK